MALRIDPVRSDCVTVIAANGPLADAPAIARTAQARWSALPGLRGAAMHLSPAQTSLVEYLQWDDAAALGRGSETSRLCYDHLPRGELWFAPSSAVRLMPGPDQAAASFALDADEAEPRPTLVSLIACEADRAQELLDYLLASAQRFRSVFGGWLGAALHPRADGLGVSEYLQFESFEAMAALQDREDLKAHKARLEGFGSFRADLVMAVATLGTEAARMAAA